MPKPQKYFTPEEKRLAINEAARRYNKRKREQKKAAKLFLKESQKQVAELIHLKKAQERLDDMLKDVNSEPYFQIQREHLSGIPKSKPEPTLQKTINTAKWHL